MLHTSCMPDFCLHRLNLLYFCSQWVLALERQRLSDHEEDHFAAAAAAAGFHVMNKERSQNASGFTTMLSMYSLIIDYHVPIHKSFCWPACCRVCIISPLSSLLRFEAWLESDQILSCKRWNHVPKLLIFMELLACKEACKAITDLWKCTYHTVHLPVLLLLLKSEAPVTFGVHVVEELRNPLWM